MKIGTKTKNQVAIAADCPLIIAADSKPREEGSLMSGKPYQVKCPPDNQLVATADWLRGALKAYRATATIP